MAQIEDVLKALRAADAAGNAEDAARLAQMAQQMRTTPAVPPLADPVESPVPADPAGPGAQRFPVAPGPMQAVPAFPSSAEALARAMSEAPITPIDGRTGLSTDGGEAWAKAEAARKAATEVVPAAPAPGQAGDWKGISPFDPAINKPRDNGDGSFSTEITITNDAPDGGFWNIPTLWWDKDGNPVERSPENSQLIAQGYERATGKKFPRFATVEEAEEAAKGRSAAGGATNHALTEPAVAVDPTRGPIFEEVGRSNPGSLSDQAAVARIISEAMAPTPSFTPTPQDYTPTGEAIMAELGNVPERIQRGFLGNRLAAAERRIVGGLQTIGLAKDADARLADLTAQKEAKFAEWQAATTPDDRNILIGEYNALAEMEKALADQIAAGRPAQVIEEGRGRVEDAQRLRVPTQATIDDLEAAMTPVNPAPGLPKALVSGIASVGDMAPGMVATLATRNPLPMLAYLGAYSRGSSYVDKRAEGYDSGKAVTAANLYAVAEAVPEMLPLHVILKEGGGALSKIVGGGATEAASEVLTQGLQQLVDIGVLDESMTWAQAQQEMIDSGMAGGVMGSLMGGGGALADSMRDTIASRRAKKGTPADPTATGPAPVETPPQDTPPAPPEDVAPEPEPAPAADAAPVVPASEGAPVPNEPQAPPEAPARPDTPAPGATISAADAESAPDRYEIMDEIEGVGPAARPTGRRVARDRQTGAFLVVDEIPAGPAAGDPPGNPPPSSAGESSQVAPSVVAGPAGGAPADSEPLTPEAKIAAAMAPENTPKAPEQPKSQPGNVEFIDSQGVAKIGTEPGVMQYKAGGDEQGVTDRLRGVTEWRPERAGMSIVYEYADGRRVIADGHQRLGLAKRLASEGKAVQMPAIILRQRDGITPEEARVTAALKNIAEGSGTAVDAAKVLRGSNQTAEQMGLPPNSAIVRDAMGMRNLSDQAFGMVVNGVSSERDGGIVGRIVQNKEAQANILALLNRLKPSNAFQAESIARQAAADVVTETQDSLFGPETDTQNLYLERARILDAAQKRVRDDLKTFRTLVDRAEAVTAAGNVLATDENARRLATDSAVRDYLTSEANTKGAISDALTAAARALHGGAKPGEATRQFLAAVERELGSRGKDGPVRDQGGRSPERPGSKGAKPESLTPEAQLAAAMKPDTGVDLFGARSPSANTEDKADADLISDLFGATPQAGKTPEQARAEAEAAVKGNQSKIRTAAPQGDAGPLFDAQPELPTEAPKTREPQNATEFIQQGRDILAKYVKPGDPSVVENGHDALSDSWHGQDIARKIFSAKTTQERHDIADDWVLEMGRKFGVEHLVAFDTEGRLLMATSGSKSNVTGPASFFRAAEAGVIGYATHNHPASSGPSGADLAMLFKMRATIGIVGNDGKKVRISTAADLAIDTRGRDVFGALAGPLAELKTSTGWTLNKILLDLKQADSAGELRFRIADRHILPVILDRLGLVRYDGGSAADIEAQGFDFEGIYGQISGSIADRLGRAGFVIPESGDRGGDRSAGSGGQAAPSGTDGTDRGTDQAGDGRSLTGDADFDGALDALFGKENGDVSGTGDGLERDRGDADPADAVGGADVPASGGRPGRGAAKRGGSARGGDGQQGAGGGLPDGDAAPVGTQGDPALPGRGGAEGKPAGGGKSRRSDVGGGKRLSAEPGRKGAAARDADGQADLDRQDADLIGKLFNEQGALFRETVATSSLHEDAVGIDAQKFDALRAMFDRRLAGVDLKNTARQQVFVEMMRPLIDAGVTRAQLAALKPYFDHYLSERASARLPVKPPAEKPIEGESRAEMQAKADRVRPVPADRANIDKTLPLLLPEQRDDVMKAETRFAKADGHGFMLTNGTGTGKTFSGGGVVKRFVQQGKGSILIVAPSDAVIAGWLRALDALGVPASQLANVKDAGQGVVLTTYANLEQNNAVASRDWHLIVTDESQHLSSNAEGAPTGALDAVRAISHRPADLWRKSRMLHADEWAAYKAMRASEAKTALYHRLKAREEREIAAFSAKPRAKVMFLSATPFAYDKSVDYAEGYLFDYPADGKVGKSNQDGRNLFFVQNFGYRIRYHKLTKPEAAVDSAVFEREFHMKLRREGVLSGRSLQVDVDYDRKFVTVSDAIGEKIDAVLDDIFKGGSNPDKALADGYRTLSQRLRAAFDYHKRMQLLEAIKARAAIPDIKKHLALGRKVVVFHDFNVGGGFNPFLGIVPADDANAIAAMADLMAKHPDLNRLNFAGYGAPADALSSAFGDKARLFSGRVPKKKRLQNLADFNTDGSGVDVLVVQADAGGAGISMHDTTGSHQRVLINLGMPVKPTTTLQQEGRILRVGSVSDAPFRYYTIGTTWERMAFARTIAERSGSVENLALGNEARDLMMGFIDAYTEAEPRDPSPEDGKGGKARDRRVTSATPYQAAITHYFGRTKITGRRDQREGMDFYPTPEPLAYKMVEWAGIRPNERVLEPSAGDGAIARYMPADGVDLTLVEPSDDLGSRALLRAPGARLVGSTFEGYHLVNKHHVIVMNPPFGQGGKTAFDHLEKAMRHLRPGGRIVALVPTGPSADRRWEKVGTGGFAVSTFILPAVTFERAGTSVMSRILIMDKAPVGSDGEVDDSVMRDMHANSVFSNRLAGATTIKEFFDRLEGVTAPRRPEAQTDAVTELEAEATGGDAAAPIERPQSAPLGASVTFKSAQTVHGKTGAPLFVATAEARTDDATYKAMLAVAKAHGGWYSSFRGAGAIPGFQFKTEEARQAFLDDMAKPVTGLEESEPNYLSHQMMREASAATSEVVRLLPRLRAELDRLDLKRVRLGMDTGVDWQGAFAITGDGAMEIVIGASLDPMKTLHHEVIHALRMMDLFTPAEWKVLELAGETWMEKHDIAARYPDLSHSEQIEEAIAEEFSEALAAKKAPRGTLLVHAFNKIARILKAIANVLRGAGFHTAEDIFGRILAGEIGRRAANNTGLGLAYQAARRGETEGKRGNQKFARQPLAARPASAHARANRATAMAGSVFIPDRGVWDELTRAGAPIWDRLRGARGGASDAIDRARAKVQDRFLPVLRAQQEIMRATGRTLPATHDAYVAETTFSGKVGRHLFEVDENFTKPIIDLISEAKGDLSVEDVGLWLYARHAIERNARIASINPKMPDGGSGMTNAEAQQILSDAAAGPHAQRLLAIGAKIDGLRERTLKLREDSGLITHDEALMWRQMYKHYVPLKGFADTDHSEATLDVSGIGRRFNIRGQESKRALGRRSEAFNPLQAALTQAQEVAIRAEKNRVGVAMYELAKDHPSPALWTVKKPAQKRYFNRTTGMVETRVEDPVTMIMEPNEMAVKVDGEEVRILFHDERLSQALGTVGADQMGTFLRLIAPLSRWFSMARTMLNPEFVITNAIRDFEAAQINIAGLDTAGKGRIALAMVKNWRKAFAGAMRGQANKADTEWSRHYRDFQRAGAQVSFWTMESPQAGKADFERRLKMKRGNAAIRALRSMTALSMRDNVFLSTVERVNLAVDNAIRLAAFVEAQKMGMSVERAAFLAKELTVNFNRRGEWGAALNTVYPFFNAATQGTTRLLQAMRNPKLLVGLTVGGIGLGLIMDLVNASLSDEDDDGELLYDKIPDYRNRRNLHLVLGGGSSAVAVPMAYGYNIFPYIGQQLGKVTRGAKPWDEAMADVGATFLQAYMPTDSLIPGLVDPIYEIAVNENYFGSSIYPDDFYGNNAYLPDAAKYFPSASAASVWIAGKLNEITGGNAVTSGWIDISPEVIDHVSAFVVGSAGSFYGRSFDTLGKAISGKTDDIETKDIPFLRVVRSEVSPWIDKDRFRQFGAEVEDAHYDLGAWPSGSAVPEDIQRKAAMYDLLLQARREIKGKGEFNQNSRNFARLPRDERTIIMEFNREFLKIAGKRAE